MDFTKLNLNGQEYNVKDEKARFLKNVNEIKSLNNLVIGDIVTTIGYYEPNDGGAASYLIRAKTESDTIDNGSLHLLNNGLVAELIIENNTFNINQFGIIGDNVTNVGEKLNTLFSSKSYVNYFIPNGTYLIDRTINIKDNVNLLFESKDAIFKATNEMDNFIVYNSTGEKTSYRCYIKNGIIDANDLCKNGLVLENFANLTIDDLNIYNIKEKGLKCSLSESGTQKTGLNANHVIVRNWNTFNSGVIGYYVNCSDSVFNNCYSIDIETGFYCRYANVFDSCHVWLYDAIPNLYGTSVAFYCVSTGYSMFINNIVDSVRTAFKSNGQNQINTVNTVCYTSPSIIDKTMQETYPFIFHDGDGNNNIMNAINCQAYFDYGVNIVDKNYNTNSSYYACDFRAGSEGSFNKSNMINKSDINYTSTIPFSVANPDFNNYYKEFKTLYVVNPSIANNAPTTKNGILEIRHSGSEFTLYNTIQTYTELETNIKFERIYKNGDWSTWEKIYCSEEKNITLISSKITLDNTSFHKSNNNQEHIHLEFTTNDVISAWSELIQVDAHPKVNTNFISHAYNDGKAYIIQLYAIGKIVNRSEIPSGTKIIADIII